MARQYGHRTEAVDFVYEAGAQGLVDALHDEFEGILCTRGALEESVAATLSKWPSFFSAYAGAHHAMEEAHKYAQYRREAPDVRSRETLPEKVKPAEAGEEAKTDGSEDAVTPAPQQPRQNLDDKDVFDKSTLWLREEIGRDTLQHAFDSHEACVSAEAASHRAPQKNFLDPEYANASLAMSTRAAGSASEFLKEVTLGMQVLANERRAAKAEAGRNRSGANLAAGGRTAADDRTDALDKDEDLAKHCLGTRDTLLTAATFYRAGPNNHKHRALNKPDDVEKVFQWIVQRKVARYPSVKPPNGVKCKPIEKCSWEEIQKDPLAKACVQKLGLLRDCFA